MADYERRNRLVAPVVRAVLSRLVGWPYDGSTSARRRLVAERPLVALWPAAGRRPAGRDRAMSAAAVSTGHAPVAPDRLEQLAAAGVRPGDRSASDQLERWCRGYAQTRGCGSGSSWRTCVRWPGWG